ncbi:MAG: type 1 glutamine amidotransferase [Pseudomonadota bacterium]
MKIGILITGHPPDTLAEAGSYDHYFERLLSGRGFSFEGWAVVDGIFPQEVRAADGWLITGSKHGAYETHEWIPPLEDFIRDVYAAGLPMIGICFGHQIIAQALGGKVEKFAGGWCVGRTVYSLEGRDVAINAWHQDQVVEKPLDAEVISETDFCKYAGLLYGNRIWTFQPHPEYDNAFIEGLIDVRGKGIVPDDLLASARAQLEKPTDQLQVAEIMSDFFKQVRP